MRESLYDILWPHGSIRILHGYIVEKDSAGSKVYLVQYGEVMKFTPNNFNVA